MKQTKIRTCVIEIRVMDSQVQADGRQQEIVDDEWRKDKLPEDDIAVPFGELPDPEADNGAGGSTGPGCSGGESLREQENKWTELGLSNITDLPSYAFQTVGQLPTHPLRNSQTISGTGGN